MTVTCAPPAARRVCILGADDSAERSLVAGLRADGYDVSLAADPSEARNPDVILVSRGVSHARAAKTMRQLRCIPRTQEAYVIVIGGRSDAADVERYLAIGADDFLIEPIDAGALRARLRVAGRMLRMRREALQRNQALIETNLCLEESNARIHRELQSAARVQRSLLPSPHLRTPGWNVEWRLRPCDELAGDILNCLPVDENHLAFYVLDVSGHGVSSALLSVQVSRLMSPMLSESDLLKERLTEAPWYRLVEPEAVALRLNRLFQTSVDNSQYFTLLYGLLNLRDGHVRLASAGHPGPIHAPAGGEPVSLDLPSNPVGFLENPRFAPYEFTLEPGDQLWLYSDGVTEVTGPGDEMLGRERLRRCVAAQKNRPLPAAVSGVMDVVVNWSRPRTPDDDCTLVVLERLSAWNGQPRRHGQDCGSRCLSSLSAPHEPVPHAFRARTRK